MGKRSTFHKAESINMNGQTCIHLVRHGHVYNPQNIFYGRRPRFRLTERGIEQARVTARFFAGEPISALYSSPLLRSRQTAAQLLAATDQRNVRLSRLITEIHSPFEGQPMAEIDALQDKLYRDVSPVFEKPQDILNRTLRFFKRAGNAFRGRQVVAVTHGDIIVFSLLWARGCPLDPALKGRLQPLGVQEGYPAHASVTTFCFNARHDGHRPSTRYWQANRKDIRAAP
jgi:broad specificity phosphatase PhoE